MIRTRSHSLDAGGLNWDSLPLKLFAGGNAKFWNPADIDFSRDRADWEALTDLERDWAARLCAEFIAGEEAVTQDIQPFMAAMRAEGRLGDEMFLTQFAFEEAKHTQVFRMWLDAVGLTGDLQHYLDDLPNYRKIFYEELPESLDALSTDPSPTAQIRASGFAPSNSLESAILITLAPGAYTALVSGAGGVTGVGLVEVYEVDRPDVPLINVSTRGQVSTGGDVMIGGFVIQGEGSQTVVVTAKGPSLGDFGVANFLANPTLTLVRASDGAVVASNDDWSRGANSAQITASGFAPSKGVESAVLVTLEPGAYTAVVSGVSGATGVALVEVYKVMH